MLFRGSLMQTTSHSYGLLLLLMFTNCLTPHFLSAKHNDAATVYRLKKLAQSPENNKLVEFFLNNNPDIDCSELLHVAIATGNHMLLQRVGLHKRTNIELAKPPASKICISVGSEDFYNDRAGNMTPAMHAAHKGDLISFVMLLCLGANGNVAMPDGQTAIQFIINKRIKRLLRPAATTNRTSLENECLQALIKHFD